MDLSNLFGVSVLLLCLAAPTYSAPTTSPVMMMSGMGTRTPATLYPSRSTVSSSSPSSLPSSPRLMNGPDPNHLSTNATFDTDSSFCSLLASIASSPGYLKNNNNTSSSGTMGRNDDDNTTTKNGIEMARTFVLHALTSIPAANYIQWNVSAEVLNATLDHITSLSCPSSWVNASSAFPFDPFIPSMEGPVAEPLTHAIAYTNAVTRVVDWTLPSQYRELYHTHGLASIMWFTWPAGTYYYDATGNVVGKSAPVQPTAESPIFATPMPPEWLHSVESIDNHSFHVLRVMFVPQTMNTTYHWPAWQELEPRT